MCSDVWKCCWKETEFVMNHAEIRLGVLGCGGFGLFALQHFTQIPGVRLVGMAGTHRQAAYAAAQRFGVPDIEDVSKLLGRDDIDLVYIATPPFLHHPQALEALQAGKHVICEKPLALTTAQAEEMIALARKNDRLVVANLMQRYNPLVAQVGRLIESRVLGDVLHGYFENYASDENLPAEHWFWDRAKSGGIFVEHGVHFFDLFSSWLGPGKVISAASSVRPGTAIEDQVDCTVRYGETVLVNFYHGFHQPGRMDRQELRLVFERGDVTLYEWVPTRYRIHAVADEKGSRELCELFGASTLDVTTTYSPRERSCQGRHKQLDVYQMFEMSGAQSGHKMHLYGRLLRSFLEDQLQWIQDRSHRRLVTEANGRASLADAAAASLLARGSVQLTS
jgi:predicted dehydrogenase